MSAILVAEFLHKHLHPEDDVFLLFGNSLHPKVEAITMKDDKCRASTPRSQRAPSEIITNEEKDVLLLLTKCLDQKFGRIRNASFSHS